MARYYYRNNWNRGGRYYGRNRYYKRSTTRTKSWGNMKAAKQQADQSTFTINIPSQISCFSKAGQISNLGVPSNVVKGVRPINIYDLLRRSEFYQNYANMYDEFKIDRIKIKLLPTEWTTSSNNQYKNITVYTAWDRTGLSKEQVFVKAEALSTTATKLGDKSANTDGIYCIVGDDITTYSSSESRTVNPNTNTSIVRWLNPKTMAEKSQWLSTSLLRKWYEDYDAGEGRFYGIPTGRIIKDGNQLVGESMEGEFAEITGPWVADSSVAPAGAQASGSNVVVQLSAANKENPCFLLEDSGFVFKPTLLVGIYPPQDESEASTNIVRFNIEAEVVTSFRGLRKAKVVAA